MEHGGKQTMAAVKSSKGVANMNQSSESTHSLMSISSQHAASLPQQQTPVPPETIIKVVSATYGPAGDKRLLTGELSNKESARIPFTRDVTPFVRALLVARRQRRQHQPQQDQKMDSNQGFMTEQTSTVASHASLETLAESLHNENDRLIRIGDQKQNFIPLMDGKSMNAIFGDPCPGTSKRLHVRYIAYESQQCHRVQSEVFRVAFAEHERVVLRRKPNFTYQDDSKIKKAIAATERSPIEGGHEDTGHNTRLKARRMGRAKSIAEFTDILGQALGEHQNANEACGAVRHRWRLRSVTSEIALPIILPFLEVRERVHCQLVCKVWKVVVQHWGVASMVDSNDQSFPNFSRAFLRGILAHSQNSLQALFLCDFSELSKDDLHPAIPHLRKLRSLDVSRCNHLDDSTMHLLAEHVSKTLEVLYMKGLGRVTDEGVVAVCRTCQKLQVLEISNIPITDNGAISIGENLPLLKALYMRDNFRLTNRSIDVITQKCNRLSQLTLWGCTKLRHLKFGTYDQVTGGNRLVLLNLWGCYSLLDEASNALAGMCNLRSLIVSECHRLTDIFLLGVAQKVPNLNHLHLRYCKKMRDEGINAIATSLQNLYSLDMSFCSRVSISAILNLMEARHGSLVELRLQHCSQLDIVRDRRQVDYQINRREGAAGRSILNVLRTYGQRSNLSLLDLRSCGGHHPTNENYPGSDPFVQGMMNLSFEQKLGGFFERPFRWNLEIEQRLVNQIIADDNTLTRTELTDAIGS